MKEVEDGINKEALFYKEDSEQDDKSTRTSAISISSSRSSSASTNKSKKISPKVEAAFQIMGESKSSELIMKHLDQHYLWQKSAISGKTAFHHILTNPSTNGISLASQKLDKCIEISNIDGKTEGGNNIVMNLEQIDVNIIRDILHYKSNGNVMKLLEHPTLRTFIKMKWRKVKWFFFLNFLIYLIFLLIYSAFLGDIFYRPSNKKVSLNVEDLTLNDGGGFCVPVTSLRRSFGDVDVSAGAGSPFLFPKDEEFEKQKKLRLKSTFSRCKAPKNEKGLSSYKKLVCSIEIGLTICLVFLFLQEVIQLLALRPKSYFREFENWLELTIIAIVSFSLITQRDVETFKWLSAIGICLSYLELIFLMGRYPLLGGRISLMFYSITKHLYRSVLTLVVLIVGFAFGFFIISHSKPNDHFENPIKAILKTLVMTLGEFEFNELYVAHEKDMVSLAFTMVLLVGLIFIGSLVLINLLVAIIVSDLSELRHIGMMQELINKAQQIILVEGLISYLSDSGSKLIEVDKKVSICGHFVCNCKSESMNEIEDIRIILKKRKLRKELRNLTCKTKSQFAEIAEDILNNEVLRNIIIDQRL